MLAVCCSKGGLGSESRVRVAEALKKEFHDVTETRSHFRRKMTPARRRPPRNHSLWGGGQTPQTHL